MKNKSFYVSPYFLFVFICFMGIAIYCGFNNQSTGYRLLMLLPLELAVIAVVINKTIKRTWKFVSFKVVYSIEVLRYVVIPFFMVFNNFYNSNWYLSPSDSAANHALILMMYDLLIEALAICFISRKLKNLNDKQYENIENYEGTNHFINYISILLIIASLALCFVGGYGLRIGFFMFEIPNLKSTLVISEQILQCELSLLYFSLMLPILKRIKTESASASDYIWMLIISFLWIGVNFGDARMAYIVKGITVGYIFNRYTLLKTSQKMTRVALILALVCVVIMTLASDNDRNEIFYFSATAEQRGQYAYTLQKYFSGPYNIAKAIEAGDKIEYSSVFDRIGQIVADCFTNVYPFYKFISRKTTAYLFNYELYGRSFTVSSQIVPLIGQGYIYFGDVFSVIPTIVLIWMINTFELNIQKRNRDASVLNLFYIYLTIYFSFFRMYNTIILSGRLVSFIVFGIGICSLQYKVKLKIIA